jgi:hypothetical protein
MLLGGCPRPSSAADLRSASGTLYVFNGGQNFTNFHAVEINRSENAGAPEGAPGGLVLTQAYNPLVKLLCAFLNIRKESVVIGGQGARSGGRKAVSGTRDGVVEPSRRCFVR